ncbi:hypothetical protein BDZ89DRAFT_1152683 [Hymenopellis radicata]|nr:hypothetical protein BDZ89DRAFT_1152683 [Hymenopellis radicata]
MTAWLSILAFGISRGMISAAILSKMDEMHLSGTNGTDGLNLWNTFDAIISLGLTNSCYPATLSRKFSESEWREAELAVLRENRHDSAPTSRWDSMDIGLGVRITAILPAYVGTLLSEAERHANIGLIATDARYSAMPLTNHQTPRLIHVVNSAGHEHELELRQCYAAPTSAPSSRRMYHYWNRFGVQCPVKIARLNRLG